MRAVPSGFAINSPFFDDSGDYLGFYATITDDGLVFEDDGEFLPHLIASGIDIESGQRRALMDTILSEADAYWDETSNEIRTNPLPQDQSGSAAIKFLSALLRMRSLEKLTRDMVRSTFKEDATEAIQAELSDAFSIKLKAFVSKGYEDYPSDIVLTPKQEGRRTIGVFLVNSSTQFLEAELLHREIEARSQDNRLCSVALIEDTRKIQSIGDRRFQRAINEGLQTRYFRGTEKEAILSLNRISKVAA